ncbi:hypothetical protein HDU77_001863 [Chytriomyces hyalinus]|nr:hypothetical protein HDU77_001863 [Chytriomyces hyalinus]
MTAFEIDERMVDTAAGMDSLLHLESMLEQSGWDDGHSAGIEMGREEGRELGQRIAWRTAGEIGFYLGVSTWLLDEHARRKDDGGAVNDRAARVLESIVSLVNAFPRVNDLDADLVPQLEKIRGKYKLAIVLLKMPGLKHDPVAMAAADGEVSSDQTVAVSGSNTSPAVRPDLSF